MLLLLPVPRLFSSQRRFAFAQNAPRPQAGARDWRFAISGDSRNCGDVVMPAIAAGIHRDSADFYWHLGDFRAIYNFDEDIQHQPEHLKTPLVISDYEALAWQDFIDSQLATFGGTPVFLALGNHETIAPKTRTEALEQLADWFNAPAIAQQRLADDPKDRRLKAYYHWNEHNVSFYTLDNSTADQFDNAQLRWFEAGAGARRRSIPAFAPWCLACTRRCRTALPQTTPWTTSPQASKAAAACMPICSASSGRRTNASTCSLQPFPLLYGGNLYNTAHWRTHGGVLPGWIVGTAGAVRYPLPPERPPRRTSNT